MIKSSQVDSPELPETPEITEMTENSTKVAKYLTKLQDTLINYVYNKLRYKTGRINFSVDSGFSNKHYDKKRKHGNAGNQHKAF